MEAAAASGSGGGGEDGVASKLVDTVMVMLAKHLQNGCFKDPLVFFDLCLSLARGIDHAVANNEVPFKSHELPFLLKQVYHCKNDFNLQAALMVLMMSVKGACQIGWFPDREKDDLLMMAKELGGCFSDTDNMLSEPTCVHPCIDKIMSRFYPKMKMDLILASIDVKPGYGAHVLDFRISKGMVAPEQEKMWLFVARTDDLDTSSCIVSPPEVSFLVNTMGVPGRTKTDMCNGPQLPTNVTAMLKYGVNLLQAVGDFKGHYIVVIAIMSLISSADSYLQDYVEPVSTSVDSDCEVTEMSSRISLNCPISLRRLRTPVKGHLCKHRQCFDFNNYLKINSRRPSWRCPHCNQPVCFPDIRIDQNIATVLSEVGENVVDVVISADGSWKPVLENNEDSAQTNDSTPVNHQKRLEQFKASSHTILTSTGAANHLTSEVKNMHQNPSSALQSSTASLSAHNVNRISSITPLSTLQQSPVQTDVISQAQQELCGRTQSVPSSFQNQLFDSYNSQLQQPVYRSSIARNAYWRLPPVDMHRQLGGYPRAMPPPPGYSHMPSMWQNSRNLDPLMPTDASSATSPANPYLPQNGTPNGGMNTQQQPSWSHINTSSVSAMGSYLMQHHSLTQGIGGPAQNSGAHGTVFRFPSMQQTRHHPYHVQPYTTQASNNFLNMAHAFVPAQPQEVQRVQRDGTTQVNGTAQRSQSTTPSVPVQQTPSRTGSTISLAMVSERLRTIGERGQKGRDGLAAMGSENQCSGRMRGSLTGEAAASYSQFILRPPLQAARASRPPSIRMPANPYTPPMQGVIQNTTFTPSPTFQEPRSHLSSGYAMNLPGSSISLPEQSQGIH